jgi:peptide/nickel transport system permease protein
MSLILKKCLKNRTFMISSVILLPIIFAAIFGPWLIRVDPLATNGDLVLKPAMAGHPLGTDEFGRDILSRLILGIRPTLIIALVATAIAFGVGLIFGIVAGYFQKESEQLIMRTVDVILCFPPILLALLVVSFWGSGIKNLIIIIGIVYIPYFARIAYSATLQIKRLEYVESEISLGATSLRILMKSVIPNIMSPMIIQITLTIASAILLESGLSFLGMGVLPPAPSWGQMIGEAKSYIGTAPMYAFWPSFCLALTILAINLIGDSLRDILDPKLNNDNL